MLLWVLQRMEGKLQVGVRPTLHCHEAAISGNRSDPRRRINTYNVELLGKGRAGKGFQRREHVGGRGGPVPQRVRLSIQEAEYCF